MNRHHPTNPLVSGISIDQGDSIMLYTVLVVLLALWLLGFSMSVGGNLIHVLLLIAIVVFLYNMFGRSRRLS
jgi:hypothetical protein